MKVISYSVFGANRFNDDNRFEFMAYLRGLYFNLRMNKLVYPDWCTSVTIDESVADGFQDYMLRLIEHGLRIAGQIRFNSPKCESMLSRMIPCFDSSVEHVLCRDTDAITTYREVQTVKQWVNSGKPIHAIIDNPAHSGLMGGMVGFETYFIKSKFTNWQSMVKGADLSKHGSDQILLNKIFSKDQDKIFWSLNPPSSDYRIKYAESDLTCRHIGSAGVVEMELLRFFQRHDKNPGWDKFENQFPEIMYWRR